MVRLSRPVQRQRQCKTETEIVLVRCACWLRRKAPRRLKADVGRLYLFYNPPPFIPKRSPKAISTFLRLGYAPATYCSMPKALNPLARYGDFTALQCVPNLLCSLP